MKTGRDPIPCCSLRFPNDVWWAKTAPPDFNALRGAAMTRRSPASEVNGDFSECLRWRDSERNPESQDRLPQLARVPLEPRFEAGESEKRFINA